MEGIMKDEMRGRIFGGLRPSTSARMQYYKAYINWKYDQSRQFPE